MEKVKTLFQRTRWHRLLGRILQEWLTPVGITVHTDLPVSSEPLKADILLLTKQSKKTKEQRLRLADGLRDSKATHLLLEFKYSESFNRDAIKQIIAYQFTYATSQNLKSDQLDCFVLSSKTPQKKTLDEFDYCVTDKAGVYTSHLPLFSEVTLLVLNTLSDEPQNIPLKLFASRREEMNKAYLAIKANRLPGLTSKLAWLFQGLWAIISKKGEKQMEATLDVDELTPEILEKVGKEWADTFLSIIPAKEVMDKFNPQERLKGLAAEERLKGLATDDLVGGLSPEQLKALKDKLNSM